MRTLLLATSNQHKLEELRAILSDLPFKLLSLKDLQLDMLVEETGATFAENAELKARAYAPIFFVPEVGKTLAELAPEQKNRISHRGRAAQAARILLEN